MVCYLVLALLVDGDHGMFASRHSLLSEGQVACYVPRVHAGVVGRLETTLLAVALVEVAAAVGACDNTRIRCNKLVWRVYVTFFLSG